MKCIPSLVVNNFLKYLRTGRYFALSVSIPRLKTGVRPACFHSDGNGPFRKLINLVTSSARTGDPKHKIRGEMPPTPTAFLGLRWVQDVTDI